MKKVMTAVIVTLLMTAATGLAEELAPPKYQAKVPESVLTPDKVKALAEARERYAAENGVVEPDKPMGCAKPSHEGSYGRKPLDGQPCSTIESQLRCPARGIAIPVWPSRRIA